MEGLLEGLVGWPEAEVTAALGLAALGGMAEGEGVVLTFFLGAMFGGLFQTSFVDRIGVVGAKQWLVVVM